MPYVAAEPVPSLLMSGSYPGAGGWARRWLAVGPEGQADKKRMFGTHGGSGAQQYECALEMSPPFTQR